MRLKGKTAVVTGAASGLGLEACRSLAEAGARIAAFDLDPGRLEALCSEVDTDLKAIEVDVADELSVSNGINEALRQFGSVDLSISCAGVSDAAKTVSKKGAFPAELWNKVVSVNLTGTFNVMKLSALAMIENFPDEETGERGVLINTASGAATQGQSGQAAYSASKAGVIGLTLPVARDLARYGVRVVAISPGLFATPMVSALPAEVAQSLIDKTTLFPPRMGDPKEFGALVRHVAENPYLNATVIDLDGGARLPSR